MCFEEQRLDSAQLYNHYYNDDCVTCVVFHIDLRSLYWSKN